MNYTLNDYKEGRCALDQIDTEIPEAAPVSTPLGTIEDYLAIHEALGGREFLLAWARANPAKFYDQLLKILEKTDTMKKSAAENTKLEQLSTQELASLSSVEIKRLLLESRLPSGA